MCDLTERQKDRLQVIKRICDEFTSLVLPTLPLCQLTRELCRTLSEACASKDASIRDSLDALFYRIDMAREICDPDLPDYHVLGLLETLVADFTKSE